MANRVGSKKELTHNRKEYDFKRGARCLKSSPRRFSLDFMSRSQKQTIVAVLLFFIILAAKYGSDPASEAVFGAIRSGLSSKNDYTPVINELAQKVLAGKVSDAVQTTNQIGLLVTPFDGKLVCGFGMQTLDEKKIINNGIYLEGPLGTTVKAPLDGVVTMVGRDEVLGRYVRVEHGNGVTSLIANLGDCVVKDKQKLKLGDNIGTLGFSAALKKPWLYWEVCRNGKAINPLTLSEPSFRL